MVWFSHCSKGLVYLKQSSKRGGVELLLQRIDITFNSRPKGVAFSHCSKGLVYLYQSSKGGGVELLLQRIDITCTSPPKGVGLSYCSKELRILWWTLSEKLIELSSGLEIWNSIQESHCNGNRIYSSKPPSNVKNNPTLSWTEVFWHVSENLSR